MLYLEMSNYTLCKGAFADVFICNESMRAFKLFKSYYHPDLDGTGKENDGEYKTNLYRTNVFRDELLAYQLIRDNEKLKRFTPIFYGNPVISSVITDGLDVSSNYLLECCIEMEYVIGDCVKLNLISPTVLEQYELKLNFKLNLLRNQFEIAGIKYLVDSSVIYNENEFKIIDFGTKDTSNFEFIT